MTVQLRRLTVRCPSCGAPPRIRASASVVGHARNGDPEAVLLTYRCHKEWPDGRRCQELYMIRARHFVEIT